MIVLHNVHSNGKFKKKVRIMDSYKILLTGIQFRKERQEVRNNLAKLFKCKPDRIEELLATAPKAIKSGLSMEAAFRYQKAIQDAGAECIIKHGDE
jgi:hypothetical protein